MPITILNVQLVLVVDKCIISKMEYAAVLWANSSSIIDKSNSNPNIQVVSILKTPFIYLLSYDGKPKH